MSRWWNEAVAAVAAVVPMPILIVLLFLAATVVALLWYWYPAWVPRRLPRWRLPNWRRPRLRLPRWRLRWSTWRWPHWRDLLRWRELLRRWRRRPKTAEPPPEPEVAADGVPELPAAEFADLADRLAADGRYAEAVRERLRGMVRQLIERGVLEHRPGWTVTELAQFAAGRRPATAGPLTEATAIFSDIWYGEQPADARHDARMRQLTEALAATLRAPAPAGAHR